MLLFTFKYKRINKQTQFRVKNCRFVVLNSWNYLMNSSQDWCDWSKLCEDSEFLIGFSVKRWNCFFFRENPQCIMSSSFFLKKITSDFWKNSNFALLAFETCQGAIWSSHSVIRVLINLHYHPTLFEAFHSVSFCEISVRFVIIGHNYQKLSLCISFSIPLLSLSPTIPMTIFRFFFTHEFFLLTSNYDIFTWFLWHLYDVVCVK